MQEQFQKDGYWSQHYQDNDDRSEEKLDQVQSLQNQIQKQFEQITSLQDKLDEERDARYKAEEELIFKQRTSEQTSYVTLYKKYEYTEKQLQLAQAEIQQMSEEIDLLAKRLEQSGFNSLSQVDNFETKDSMIQRLNMRVTQLKMREDQLLEDNALLEVRLSEQFHQEAPVNLSVRQSDNYLKREMEIIQQSKTQLKDRLKEALEKENQISSKLDYQVKECLFQEQQNNELQEEIKNIKKEIKNHKEQQQKLKQIQIENESTIYALEQTLKTNSNLGEIKDQLKLRMDKDLTRIQEDYNKQTRLLESELEHMKHIVDSMRNEATKSMQQTSQIKGLYEVEATKQEQKLQLLDQNLKKEQAQIVVFQKQVKKANDELQKSKNEKSNQQEMLDLDSKRRDKQETQLKDKIIVLQDQIASIMRDKQQAQSHLSQDLANLHDQYRGQIQTLQLDNKDLERRCLDAQAELNSHQSNYTLREDELMKEVKLLQKKLQQLMDQQIDKRKSRSKERLSRSPYSNEASNKSLIKDNINIKNLQDALDEERLKTGEERVKTQAALQNLKSTQIELIDVKNQLEREFKDQQQKQQQLSGIQDLQHSVLALRNERERVAQQIQMKEQQSSELRDQINGLNRELQQSEAVQKQAQIINDTIMAEFQVEVEGLRHQIDKQQDHLELQQQEIDILQDERRRFNEQIIYQNLEGDDIKAQLHQKSIDANHQVQQLQKQIQEVITDHQQSQEHSYHIKLQLDEQKDHFEDLISKLNNIIDILKEKFQSDLQELQTRQNIYFNQNNVIKQSLSQQKESQQLIQLITQYSDNVVSQANNLAKTKQAQEQKKQLAIQLNVIKEQLKNKTQAMEQISLENQELLKKVERYRPRNYSQNKSKQLQQQTQLQQDIQPIIVQLQEGLVTKLQADVTTIKTKLRLASATADQLTLVNKALEVDCKNMQNQMTVLQQQVSIKDSSIQELQKHHKNEIEKVLKDMTNMQTKIVSEDKFSGLQDNVILKDQQIKDLQSELARRRDVNQQFRSDKEDKELIIEQLKQELQTAQEDVDKYKKQLKESSRKDSHFKDIKEKIDLQKQTDKQLNDENKSLSEKLKISKVDLQRKDGQIKELKDKIEELHNVKQDDSDKKESAQQSKKLKEEIQRKDQTLKHYKQKLEEKSNEVEFVKNDHVQKYSSSIHDLEREQRKSEQIRVLQKKQENQVNMLLFLLKRIYRENFMQLQQGKQITQSNAKTSASVLSQYQQSKPNLSRFSESMNILNISPDDLEEFLEPNIAATKSDISLKKVTMKHEDLDRFEENLSNLETIDVNKVFDSIQNLIYQRVIKN